MGWSLPWVSSANSDFNLDFGASSTEELTPPDGLPPIVGQNAAAAGTDVGGYLSEAPVMSAFTLQTARSTRPMGPPGAGSSS